MTYYVDLKMRKKYFKTVSCYNHNLVEVIKVAKVTIVSHQSHRGHQQVKLTSRGNSKFAKCRSSPSRTVELIDKEFSSVSTITLTSTLGRSHFRRQCKIRLKWFSTKFGLDLEIWGSISRPEKTNMKMTRQNKDFLKKNCDLTFRCNKPIR